MTSRMISVANVDLDVIEAGRGPALLFLHSGTGLEPGHRWLATLAERYRVIAPHHPGFGRSALPDSIGTVDDLAYLYLDLARQLDLNDAVLVGADFGAWIAAEMMVRSTAQFSRLVLSGPVGIKVRGPLDRDIADLHGMPADDARRLAWANPEAAKVDYERLPETELAAIARGREALALFGWKPYMHNPRLKRWLHRIDRPTRVIWGDKDGVVSKAYCEAWCGEISGAELQTIADAGHYPHLEQPDAFARCVG